MYGILEGRDFLSIRLDSTCRGGEVWSGGMDISICCSTNFWFSHSWAIWIWMFWGRTPSKINIGYKKYLDLAKPKCFLRPQHFFIEMTISPQNGRESRIKCFSFQKFFYIRLLLRQKLFYLKPSYIFVKIGPSFSLFQYILSFYQYLFWFII